MTKRDPTKETAGAWVVHHGQKASAAVGGAAEFPALDTASKAASLLSHFAASSEVTLAADKVKAAAVAAGLNTRTELPSLLQILEAKRVISSSKGGDVVVLGLTTTATVHHAAEIFEEQGPSAEERAAIDLAERATKSPLSQNEAMEWVIDRFKLRKFDAGQFLDRAESIGFVDAEGDGADKLIFNSNVFRRDTIQKTQRILAGLSSTEAARVSELEDKLSKLGCIDAQEAEKTLGDDLWSKLRAAGMYDVNNVLNSTGTFSFVTRPSAFHKFSNPLVDDAFDLAKALVAALTYGMTQSGAGRGRITLIQALLAKLLRGETVGPATAIGEDYKVLELKRVIQVAPAKKYGYTMRLLKHDVGEMALKVLTTGEAASGLVLDRPLLPGSMTGFVGPEQTRSRFRTKTQTAPSKRHMMNMLQTLRTGGGGH